MSQILKEYAAFIDLETSISNQLLQKNRGLMKSVCPVSCVHPRFWSGKLFHKCSKKNLAHRPLMKVDTVDTLVSFETAACTSGFMQILFFLMHLCEGVYRGYMGVVSDKGITNYRPFNKCLKITSGAACTLWCSL